MRCRSYLPLLLFVLLFPAASLALTSGVSADHRFVRVEGSHLTLDGRPIRLKGTNYYPGDNPWAFMWQRWHGPVVDRELDMARVLGMNTVRILVPYNPNSGWTTKEGDVKEAYLDRLREFVCIAGTHQLKVNITLFDWYDGFHPAGTEEEKANLRYLRTIVETFKDNDCVLAWDLHNEPDHYSTWEKGGQRQVIDWLARMAAEIRRIDPNHPVTVGVGKAETLWLPGHGGLTIIDISDFVSFHSYDVLAIEEQVAEIRSRTTKPILLQETGWPTGPECGGLADYNEGRQSWLYQRMIEVAVDSDLAGIVQWTLFDFKPYRSFDWMSDSDYYGLVRRDGTIKPAGYVFAGHYEVEPLPSRPVPHAPLTIAPIPPSDPFTKIENETLHFVETGHSLKTTFKDYWRRKGREGVFGLPITEQLLEGDKVVQYFERARLERPKYIDHSKYEGMTKLQKLEAVVTLGPLGRELAGDGRFPPLESPPPGPQYRYFLETGHSIANDFRKYWEENDGLRLFGYPISEEITEVGALDGVSRTVQYFERARFEYHPELKGTPGEVQLGRIGREYVEQRLGCEVD